MAARGGRLPARGGGGGARLRLGRDMVDVQCRLGTYSLSAHADEGQLLSLVDALDPAEVVLAHGDEGARASLGRRLEERGRSVRSPRSGQALEFHFSPRAGTRRREALGADRPLDTRRLWEGVAGPVGGGYFTSRELAHAWWGEDAAAEDLEDALPAGDLYFAADRPGVYRARTAKQVEALLRRGEALAAWGLRRGQVLFLRDGPDGAVGVARCAGVAAGQFTIEGDPLPRGPEALLDLLEPDEAPADLEAIGALADALAPSLRLQPGTAVTVDDLAEEGGRTHGLSPTDAARRGEPVCSPALRAPEPARRGEPVCSPTAGAPEPARTGQPVCQPTASAPEPARTGQPVCSPAAGAPEPARRGEPVCSPTAGTPDAARTGEPVCSPKPAQPPADLRAALVLALLRAGARREPGGSEYLLPAQAAPVAAAMEPNQALAHVRAQFPPEARLRRCGYRAEEGALTLTFDFPDAAVVRWAEALARIPDETGWQVQVDAEANQGALNALARDLAEGLDLAVAKGPAIYREEKRVAVTVRGGSEGLADACRRFQETTGYALGVLGPGAPDGASGVPAGAAPYPAAGTPAPPNMPSGGEADAATLPGVPASVWITPSAAAPSGLLPAAERALPGLRGDALPLPRPADAPARAEDALTGTRWEINAACAAVRSALAGSTLYRTSLSGDRIVLSFISLPVGERYRAEIEALSRQTGWPLEINPRPNQAAILETARRLAGRWQILKGPGLRADQGTVEMALAVLPDEEERIAAEATFEAQTGFRLVLAEGAPAVAAGPTPVPAEAVEIPVERIRLTAAQRSTVLNPAKADKAVRRALGLGRIAPPLQVRRLADGYLLLDGLYRLNAARALGWERVPALVEE